MRARNAGRWARICFVVRGRWWNDENGHPTFPT
jgi:hypothetical protein